MQVVVVTVSCSLEVLYIAVFDKSMMVSLSNFLDYKLGSVVTQAVWLVDQQNCS